MSDLIPGAAPIVPSGSFSPSAPIAGSAPTLGSDSFSSGPMPVTPTSGFAPTGASDAALDPGLASRGDLVGSQAPMDAGTANQLAFDPTPVKKQKCNTCKGKDKEDHPPRAGDWSDKLGRPLTDDDLYGSVRPLNWKEELLLGGATGAVGGAAKGLWKGAGAAFGEMFGSAGTSATEDLASAGVKSLQGTAVSDLSADGSRLYRLDGRDMGTVFEDGFQPRGTSTNFDGYVLENQPSTFVGSSTSADIVNHPNFVNSEGNLYEIDGGHTLFGVNSNQYFADRGMVNPFATENESAFTGGVPSGSIVGGRQVFPDRSVGDLVPNPNYIGPSR